MYESVRIYFLYKCLDVEYLSVCVVSIEISASYQDRRGHTSVWK